jgi:hypothetical protein
MTGAADCELLGRWRIIAADLWDRDYLDMVEPAYLQIGSDGWAEFAFGASPPAASWNTHAPSSRWRGFDDEGDEVSGDGSAELQDDATLEIELSFDNGDDATLIGRRE